MLIRLVQATRDQEGLVLSVDSYTAEYTVALYIPHLCSLLFFTNISTGLMALHS